MKGIANDKQQARLNKRKISMPQKKGLPKKKKKQDSLEYF